MPHLRKGPSGPLANLDEEQCPALTRVLYVDNNTLVPPADQNGSICAPFDSIQDALDNTLPIVNTTVGVTVLNLILITPGFYDENPVIPQTTHIALQGLGGLPNPSLVIPGNGLLGASVYIADPALLAVRTVSISYSDLDASTVPRSVPPFLQFSHIALDRVEVNADGANGALLSLVVQAFDDCVVADWIDVGAGGISYDATLDVRDSVFDQLTCPAAIVMYEHSQGFTMDVGVINASDCIIDDLTVNEQTTLGTPFTNFALANTLINSSVVAAGEAINLTADTSFFAERLGAIATSQARRVQDNLATAYHHQVITDTSADPFTFDEAITCVFRLNALPGVTNLPSIDAVLRRTATSSGQMCQQRIVKNLVGSGAATTVTPAGGQTINGGATFVLAAGDSIICVPQSATNWEVIGKL